jgi:chromosome segregation ATPase
MARHTPGQFHKTMELKELESKVAQLDAANKAALKERDALQKQLEALIKENTALKTQNAEAVTELQKANDLATAHLIEIQGLNSQIVELDNEIADLSKELTNSKKDASASVLSITVLKKRYTTPPGRKYNVDGKEVTSEELIKDTAMCQSLIEKGSHIFTEA